MSDDVSLAVVHRPMDTSNRRAWHSIGERLERDFLAFNRHHKILAGLILNPEKITNPTAPDFRIGRSPVDIKTQETPFFFADRYGIPASFAVTLNAKDVHYYSRCHPGIGLIFWVRFGAEKRKFGHTIKSAHEHHAVYGIRLKEVCGWISRKEVFLHAYQKRRSKREAGTHYMPDLVDAEGNANASYVLDTRRMTRLWAEIVPAEESAV